MRRSGHQNKQERQHYCPLTQQRRRKRGWNSKLGVVVIFRRWLDAREIPVYQNACV